MTAQEAPSAPDPAVPDEPLPVIEVRHGAVAPDRLLDAWPDQDRSTRPDFVVRDLERDLFERSLAASDEGPPGRP